MSGTRASVASSNATARPASVLFESLQAGQAYPLGATAPVQGINFALVAPHAERVELCLFDDSGLHERQRLLLPSFDDGVWHGFLSGAATGLVYGYRVHGRHAPQSGHRFNPAKLLLDPYARDIVGIYLGQDAFRNDDPADTGAIALKARVVDETFDWDGDAPPRVASAATVLYEAHVKGLTRLHPQVPPALRGSYAGLAQPAVLDHLLQLGVTSVSLLPVHHRADEARLQKAGLSNYWGYSSIGFFAPEPRYWSGSTGSTPISEFRQMVKTLHAHGIEVLLDVVYNHTAETDEFGPTLSFRGIDNALYYHLQPDDATRYENWTGCGNVLKLHEPRVLQLVLDSLRYWVQDMHVDGFRFDLAPVLARDANGFNAQATFFAALAQDPVLAGVKLIAEPWDIGAGGYQLGNFPPRWLEWNDRYRDTMRAFWLRRDVTLGAFAMRLTGSSDLFRQGNRPADASVNFITAHDGFTLHDLVRYQDRHNEANGENNRDGHANNLGCNCGVEGPTTDEEIRALRGRLQRALLATLLLSQGTPMLLAGDELSNTQGGNNNAYCQDNPVGWLDWEAADTTQLAFVQRLIALRRRFPALAQAAWHDAPSRPDDDFALRWLSPAGPMHDDDWQACDCVGLLSTARVDGESCLLLFNADPAPRAFCLPSGTWSVLLDSAHIDPADAGTAAHVCSGAHIVPAQAVVLAVCKQAAHGGEA
ncbi:MAG: glycogen debranching protein GlgX [Herminiimonas sp.]|nr:glycogen debranching protein GlgX [Herminiimonas sp.]